MLEDINFFTPNGNVPNDGIVPGTIFVSVDPSYYPFSGPPPPCNGPQYNGNVGVYGPSYPMMHTRPPPPAPRTPASEGRVYDPPGQYVNGQLLHGEGCPYIAPSKHARILFLLDGTRPFDFPNGYYPYEFEFQPLVVPTIMTVKEMIKQLGAPAGSQYGFTEMEELGDHRFTAGITITQGSDDANMTLAEVGWTERRSELAPIWLTVKS